MAVVNSPAGQGLPGIPAFASIVQSYQQPVIGGSVTVALGTFASGATSSAASFVPGTTGPGGTAQPVFVGGGGGFYQVAATNTQANTVTLVYLGQGAVPSGQNVVASAAAPVGITSGGLTGQTGPNAFSTLSANLTLPAPGSTVVAQIENNTWMGVNGYYLFTDGTHTATLQATAVNVDGIHVTLLNPNTNVGNPATGTVINATGSMVTVGSGAFTATTALLANFTIPLAGATATANVGSTAFMVAGLWVGLSDGTNVATLKIQSVTDGQHVVLLNVAGFSGNALPGVVVNATNSICLISAQPGGLIGQSTVGTTIVANDASPVGTIQPTTTLVLYTVPGPPIALGEVIGISAFTTFWSTTTSDVGHVEQRMTIRNNGGTLTDPLGLTVGTDVTAPSVASGNYVGTGSAPGGQLAGTTAQIQIVGGAIQVAVHNPSSTLVMQAFCEVSYARSNAATLSAGPAPVIISASVTTGGAGGNTQTALTGQHFTGVTGIGASVTLDGAQASFVPGNPVDTTLVVTSGINATGAGVGPIIVTHPLNGPSNTNINWTYTDDPGAIAFVKGAFAANVVPSGAWGRYDSINLTGGTTFLSWADKSPNANGNATITGGAPTYNSSSATWTPNRPSVTFNGTSDQISLTGLSLGAADQGVFAWIVQKVLAADGSIRFQLSFASGQFRIGITDVVAGNSFTGDTNGSTSGSTVITGAAHGVWGFCDAGSVGATGQAQNSVDNATPSTVTALRVTKSGSGTLVIGSAGGGNWTNTEIVEWGIVALPAGVHMSNTQLSRFHAYWQSTYGTP